MPITVWVLMTATDLHPSSSNKFGSNDSSKLMAVLALMRRVVAHVWTCGCHSIALKNLYSICDLHQKHLISHANANHGGFVYTESRDTSDNYMW